MQGAPRARCNPSYDACGKLLTLLSTKLSARVARGVFMMVGDKSGAFRVPDFCDCRWSLYCPGFRGWLFLLVSVLQLISYPSLWQVLESRTIGKRGIQRILARLRFSRHLNKKRLILVYFWLPWLATWLSMVTLLNVTRFSRVVLQI